MGNDPTKRKEYYEKNKEKENENSKRDYEKNKEKYKERRKERYEQNKERDAEREKERVKEYYEKRRQNAYDSISSGRIIDQHKWNLWCNAIKISVNNKEHAYSDDFTNDVMFEMMVRGCFYCEDIATTIDRIDSNIGHTIDNCVGCCHVCNISKNNADFSTFVKKAYYRARNKYYDDDTNIWFVYNRKPSMCDYKRSAQKKGVSFELSKGDFDILTKGDCKYCKRSPITWFGIDRVVPSLGYTFDNVVSCCLDCNLDKLEDDVDTMLRRNERVALRVDTGELVIGDFDKMILHRGLYVRE